MRPVIINKIFDEVLGVYTLIHLGFAGLHIPLVQDALLSIPDDRAMLSIKSSFPKEDLNLPIKNIVNKIKFDQQQSPQPLTKVSFATLACIFIIYAYNIFEENGLLKKFWNEPIVQFFCHIRNGCAHNNKFYLKGKNTLVLKAEWKGKIINTSLVGKTVINDFFKEGDFGHLLEDLSKLK